VGKTESGEPVTLHGRHYFPFSFTWGTAAVCLHLVSFSGIFWFLVWAKPKCNCFSHERSYGNVSKYLVTIF
jgi:hypothetical protein